MSDIFGGVEPPRWLQEIAKPIDAKETGQVIGTLLAGMTNAYKNAKEKNDNGEQTSWIKELPSSLHEAEMNIADPMWRLKLQQSQLNIASQKLAMDGQQQALTAKKQQLEWMNHDVQTFPQWMQEHPTPDSRQGATPPELLTPQFQKTYQEVLKADINHDAQRDFSKQVDELRKVDPIAAAKYAPLIGRPIPPKAADSLASDLAAARAKVSTDVAPKTVQIDVNGKKETLIYNPKSGHFERAIKGQGNDAVAKAESQIAVAEIKDLNTQLHSIDREKHPDQWMDIQSKINAARKRLRKILSGETTTVTSEPATAPTADTSTNAPIKVGAWEVTPVP